MLASHPRYHMKLVGAKVLRDYSGMNYKAAQAMRMPWHYSHNTILVDKTAPPAERRKIFFHEIVELKEMEKKHCGYWKAHTDSLHYWRKK